MQFSSTCFWSALVSVDWSVPRNLQFLFTDDTATWRVSAAQHNAHFQRQLRNLGVSHQHYTLHGLRGGGAVDHWLQYRDLPQLRRRGEVDL